MSTTVWSVSKSGSNSDHGRTTVSIQAAIPLWQLLTVTGVPTLTILVWILVNRWNYLRLEARASQLHIHLLREFEGRLSKLESRP
jgi:hypothetical protein